MAEYAEITLADLIIDVRNARLKDEQPSEQAALLAIAGQQRKRLLNLASDIVDKGLDPTTLVAVMPTDDQRKRYLVIEGNRRVVALKALETPSLISPALNNTEKTRLNKLAGRFAQKPISTVACVMFESEQELEHWVTLRHTGQNEGIGLVPWGSEEQDRYTTRHGHRSPMGQIIDFVEKHGSLSEEAKRSNRSIITNLKRLINTPAVREALGIDMSDGQVSALYPTAEVAKSLTRVVDDLKTARIKVGDIYREQNRLDYVQTLPASDLPDPSTRLPSVRLLDHADEASGDGETKEPTTPRKPPRRQPPARTSLIPKSCRVDITPPRINNIYNELLELSVDRYPNAASVSLRVFVELSVDHYVDQNKPMSGNINSGASLAKRIKAVADALEKKGSIDLQLKRAVYKMADSSYGLSASTVTFNQYVHNKYVYPTASELRTAWDELQPFVEKIWE